MAILHTVNSSPFQTYALQQCLALLNNEDTLLLIEDAVIASQAKHTLFDELEMLSKAGRLMVLASDLEARGVNNLIAKACSYKEFVELVVNHQSQIAW